MSGFVNRRSGNLPGRRASAGLVHIPVLVLLLLGLVALSFYLMFKGSPGIGLLLLLLSLIVVPALIVLSLKAIPRTGWGQNLVRDNPTAEEVTATGAASGLTELVGKSGKTVTRCRPSGMAVIDGRRVDVVADGTMIDSKCPVEVVRVEGNRVVIQKVQAS